MSKINELRAQRAKTWEQTKAFLDSHRSDKGVLSAEDTATYENPNFRMQLASSAGAPIRSMQISGGMKGGVLPGMLEMANGHFFRGIRKMIKG